MSDQERHEFTFADALEEEREFEGALRRDKGDWQKATDETVHPPHADEDDAEGTSEPV